MAIIKEYYRTREDGERLIRTYSDKNLYIQKLGTTEIYSESISLESKGYEYIETDKEIEEIEEMEDEFVA
jgi:hypothetical protein